MSNTVIKREPSPHVITRTCGTVVRTYQPSPHRLTVVTPGPQGAQGPQGPAGEDYDPTTDFAWLKANGDYIGKTSVAGGLVLEFSFSFGTRYAFIPDPYDSSQHSYYTGFDGTTLSGLVTTKGDV